MASTGAHVICACIDHGEHWTFKNDVLRELDEQFFHLAPQVVRIQMKGKFFHFLIFDNNQIFNQ